jgi:hypothetical protein
MKPSPIEWRPGWKRCSICTELKPLDEFYRNRSRPDGRAVCCSVCDRKDKYERYWQDPEQSRAYLRAKRVANPERQKEWGRESYARHAVERRQYAKEYVADPERAARKRAYFKAYREENREKLCAQNRAYYAARRAKQGSSPSPLSTRKRVLSDSSPILRDTLSRPVLREQGGSP